MWVNERSEWVKQSERNELKVEVRKPKETKEQET